MEALGSMSMDNKLSTCRSHFEKLHFTLLKTGSYRWHLLFQVSWGTFLLNLVFPSVCKSTLSPFSLGVFVLLTYLLEQLSGHFTLPPLPPLSLLHVLSSFAHLFLLKKERKTASSLCMPWQYYHLVRPPTSEHRVRGCPNPSDHLMYFLRVSMKEDPTLKSYWGSPFRGVSPYPLPEKLHWTCVRKLPCF